jgi:4-hydroxythreonine-4-phosphate dehydrogenase
VEISSRIAITMGDPAGIGPEIIVKAFQDTALNRICRPVVVGDARHLQTTAQRFTPDLEVRALSSLSEASYEARCMNVIDLGNVPPDIALGQSSEAGGKASVEFIRKATSLALENQVDAITTAPINKESMHRAGFIYPGHTEFLAELTGAKEVALMLAGKNLRVVLVTTHLPLKEVHQSINKSAILSTVRLTHNWCRQYVTDSPQIAVTGLNPHASDGGIFGREEKEIITPALAQAQSEGISACGPLSADSLFAHGRFHKYDAVITMYHDQGMIPVKMDSQGSAVNITLGLPILRTSVDHGTAYDIAGTGQADPASLQRAIAMAARLAAKPALATQ